MDRKCRGGSKKDADKGLERGVERQAAIEKHDQRLVCIL